MGYVVISYWLISADYVVIKLDSVRGDVAGTDYTDTTGITTNVNNYRN